jgi:hypothetical protein
MTNLSVQIIDINSTADGDGDGDDMGNGNNAVGVGNKDLGVWNATTTYTKGNLVIFGRYRYVCTVSSSTNVVPSVDPNWRKYWDLASTTEYIPQGIGFDRLGSVLQLQANANETN